MRAAIQPHGLVSKIAPLPLSVRGRQTKPPPKRRRARIGAEARPAALETPRRGKIAHHDGLAAGVADELLGDVKRLFIVAGQRNAQPLTFGQRLRLQPKSRRRR